MTPTDWDSYYRKPQSFTPITRRWTCAKLINVLKPHVRDTPLSVCEFGGANSCIASPLDDALNIETFHAIDTNEYGLSLLSNLNLKAELKSELGSVLDDVKNTDRLFDVVISVGLVEHFTEPETRKAIRSHFENCIDDGLVLITFPTPTWLYKTIRGSAELLGIWAFPDERPLRFAEVVAALPKNSEVLHQSIHWKIGLTQGVILVRCNAK